MSAISQKSISGITSITTPAGIDDQLTLHTSDTSQAAKLDGAGNFHFSNHVNTTGITSASNFKTGSSNLHSTGLTVGDSFVHSTGINIGSNIKFGSTGVITATSFVGDGSDLTNLPAGLGTALSATATSPLNKMYYTNAVLGIAATTTVDVPASASAAYTQYADINIATDADLIIADGDDLIPDVLGLADFGTFGGGTAGRLRVSSISNHTANGAPTVQHGLVITGVTTSTTFSGSGASLTNLPAAQLSGTAAAINGSNITNLNASNISSGTVPTARLGSGTANSSTFLAGDSTFKTVTGTTINNNANNRVITGSGSANTLEGESDLTFDGNQLYIDCNNYSYPIVINSTQASVRAVIRQTNDANANSGLAIQKKHSSLHPANHWYGDISFEGWDGSGYHKAGLIECVAEGTPANDNMPGGLRFSTNAGAAGVTERLRLSSTGNLALGSTHSSGFANHTNFFLGGMGNLYVDTSASSGSSFSMSNNAYINSSANWVYRTGGKASNIYHYEGVIGLRNAGTGSAGNTISWSERLRIDSDGIVTTPSQPSFRATKSGGPYSHSTGTFVWDQNQHNTGSNYNTSNGRFTAPVAGVYLFHAYSIYTGNSSNDTWDFQKNGSNFPGSRLHFTNSPGGAWDNVTNTCIVSLAANDYITLRASSQEYHGGDWTAFCGTLIG